MAMAGLSLMDPAGLKYSILPSSLAWQENLRLKRLSSSKGVLPIVCVISAKILGAGRDELFCLLLSTTSEMFWAGILLPLRVCINSGILLIFSMSFFAWNFFSYFLRKSFNVKYYSLFVVYIGIFCFG